MTAAIHSVLTIFSIVAVGFFFTRKDYFDESTGVLFTKIIVNIALPPMIIYSLTSYFSKTEFLEALPFMVVPILGVTLSGLFGWILAKLIKIPLSRRGLFITMFLASNTIFIGMPVNLALFGEKSVPALLLYYAVNTTVFWTIGIWLIHRDAGLRGSILNGENLKKLVNPPFTALWVGFLFVLIGIPLPAFLSDSMRYIGNLTTPLSLLFIGITFRYIKIKDIPLNGEMLLLMFGRFILAPGIILILGQYAHLPALMLKVFVIQAGMPIITQAAISANSCGADYKYATSMVTISNGLSLVFIPLYMVVFTLLKL